MKTCHKRSFLSSIPRWPLTATAACLLTLATPDTRAAAGVTSYTSTGYYLGVPYPGDTLAFAPDNVHVRNMLSLLRVQSSAARLTGRRTVLSHGYYHPDGSGTIYGTWTGEVGTWDLTDPAAPKFTATAGLWDGSWQGAMQANHSWQVKIIGRGTGGAVDGLELIETATRGPGPLEDLAIPINYTGILGPAGALNVRVLDDCDDGNTAAWQFVINKGAGQLIPANGQLTVRGDWRGVRTGWPGDTGAWGVLPNTWKLQDGQTIELRVDVVSLSQTARDAQLWFGDVSRGYALHLGKDYLVFQKFESGRGAALQGGNFVAVKHTRVVLAFALTAAGDNLILTGRVFDKDNPTAMLYETSSVDTPGADPVISNAEIKEKLGMDVSFDPDWSGRPWTSGVRVNVGVWQYTDGTLDPAEATFDNLELRTYDVPLLAIGKAVRLQWPASAFPFTVEGASTIQGPWLPVLEPVFESGGVKQVTVPTSDAMRVFRRK
ncbi:MAG: hypothetical protein HS113_24140 [Verrucomicrobiales bacterium]|nr:hypothetical protein [Verrucomicrobiales bacterium]